MHHIQMLRNFFPIRNCKFEIQNSFGYCIRFRRMTSNIASLLSKFQILLVHPSTKLESMWMVGYSNFSVYLRHSLSEPIHIFQQQLFYRHSIFHSLHKHVHELRKVNLKKAGSYLRSDGNTKCCTNEKKKR